MVGLIMALCLISCGAGGIFLYRKLNRLEV